MKFPSVQGETKSLATFSALMCVTRFTSACSKTLRPTMLAGVLRGAMINQPNTLYPDIVRHLYTTFFVPDKFKSVIKLCVTPFTSHPFIFFRDHQTGSCVGLFGCRLGGAKEFMLGIV